MARRQGVNANGELYDGPYVQAADDFGLDCSKDGLTRQEFRDECDINILMARYENTGVISHVARGEPAYFDCSEVPDLQQALAIVAHATDAFMTLPAKARAEFDNDPVRFHDFAVDPQNLPRMREWGLAPPEKVPDAPMRVEVVNTPLPDPPKP